MKTEIWKSVTNYEGYYEVSNLGRVRSLTRQIEKRENGNITILTRTGKITTAIITEKGYERVGLSKDAVQKNCLVHRLVGIEFIDNPEGKPQINHINGIKTDNNVDNLEWVTNEENFKHSVELGLRHYQKV